MASDLTDARRKRVRELFGKADKRIAEILIEEGHFGPVKRTKEVQHLQLETARRTVSRDKQWWRKLWSDEKRKPARMTNEEYISRLETRISDLDEMLDDAKIKSTPRVQAIDTLRKIEESIAKASGVDVLEPKPPGDGPAAPFIGLIMDLSECSSETKEKLTKGVTTSGADESGGGGSESE